MPFVCYCGPSSRPNAIEDGAGEPRVSGAVVVYVDSEAALPAASWAARQCTDTAAAVQLVGCTGNGVRRRVSAVADLLDRAAAGVKRQVPGVSITTGLLAGRAASALTELSGGAAMLVMADDRTARDLPEASALSWTLATRVRCPLVVWRPPAGDTASAPVVVGVDGSPVSARALDFALMQASRLRVPLVVVMAWSDVFFDSERQVIGMVTDWATVERRYRGLLAEQLTGAQERFPDVGIERVLTHDRPVRALLREAAGAQLLVVGSRGRGGFPGMLLGSVSRALLDHSPCPLAVVRSGADA